MVLPATRRPCRSISTRARTTSPRGSSASWSSGSSAPTGRSIRSRTGRAWRGRSPLPRASIRRERWSGPDRPSCTRFSTSPPWNRATASSLPRRRSRSMRCRRRRSAPPSSRCGYATPTDRSAFPSTRSPGPRRARSSSCSVRPTTPPAPRCLRRMRTGSRAPARDWSASTRPTATSAGRISRPCSPGIRAWSSFAPSPRGKGAPGARGGGIPPGGPPAWAGGADPPPAPG